MAPTKNKYRGVNKQFLNSNDVSPDRDVENSTKSRQRKRKLSDMLGPQWSKEELDRFYEAYRKYGKDWKKVAGAVHNRSLKMVEALYTMNQAYLSLPEGTASVVGLIAMMTDYYNVLGGSDNGSNDASGTPRKAQKPWQGKVHLRISKEDLLQPPLVANDGCLSLLKRSLSDGIRPHAVKKRTPRFLVSYSHKKDDDALNNVNLRSDLDMNDDKVAHVAALTLTKASQREGCRHASQAPIRRTEHMKASPAQSRERMTKIHGTVMDEDYFEGNLESRVADNGDYAEDTCSLMDSECAGIVEVLQDGKKCYDNEKVEVIRNIQFNDCREACSDTEGHNINPLKRKIDTAVRFAKTEHGFPSFRRKRSKKFFYGDETSGLDALQTLADLSLTMLDSAVESGSSMQLKEEKINLDNVHEAMPTSYQSDNNKLVVAKERVAKEIPEVEVTTSKKYKHRKDSAIDVNALSEAKQQAESSNKQLKRKGKSLSSKALTEEGNKSVINGRHDGQIAILSKQWKSTKPLEHSLNSDQKEAKNDLAGATASHVNLKTNCSRRKLHLKKKFVQKEMKSPENSFNNQSSKDFTPLQYSTDYLKRKISCSLSSYMARRWFTFEWFYSAIDYPWFAKKEFVEYLDHVGLGHIPRLSRVEWGVIRSSLGKPRRFSEHFLCEEKEKLKQYRESVRKHYTELRTGAREGLPRDLARPLSVGQQVIALHPKTREVHNGSVLTVDHDKCMVQFDRPEIGVQFVMDIDCMPADPFDNLPEALRRQNSTVGRFPVNSKEQKVRHLENAHTSMNSLIKQAKEALLMELKHANNDVLGNEDGFLKDSESFKKHCAMVSSALLYLRQCESNPRNTLPPWLKTSTISGGPLTPASSVDNLSSSLEPGFRVDEIVMDSRSKADRMVHAAMKAISSMKEEEDAFTTIGEALDSMHKQQLRSDSGVSVLRLLDPVNGCFTHPNQLTTLTSEPQVTSHASGPNLPNDSGKKEAPIPSELITSCVATLLMIQTCTEGQYPPADVAQILDSAVTSLHPSCPQNLPIYREIEMCMGRIKTQILALVPTLH